MGFLLHAIAGCLTSGLANVEAARGVTLHRVPATVRGDIDLLGILGLSDTVRNGCRQVRVSFEIEGDASRRNSPHRSSGPGRGRPSMTCWSTAPMPSSTSPHHRWPDSASAHRMLNGSTPDPGTPGVYAGPDNRGVYAGPDHYRGLLVGELSGLVYDGSLLAGRDNRKLELGELFGEVVDGARFWWGDPRM